MPRTNGKDVSPVPLGHDHVNPSSRVVMVSHRWNGSDQWHDATKSEPCCKCHKDRFDFVFFYWRCILTNKKVLTKPLVKVDELYAQSHCLCRCHHPDYFCAILMPLLWNLLVNKFNADLQTILPHGTTHPPLRWPQRNATDPANNGLCANCLAHTVFAVSNNNSDNNNSESSRRDKMSLHLPTDHLHLKSELRRLFRSSHITHRGDMFRFILQLLDTLGLARCCLRMTTRTTGT
jgi:hypothetical protein